MQIQIGTFQFEAAGGGVEYTDLTRLRRRRWAQRERHGRPPELDDLGRDAEQITLRGTIWIRSSADLAGLAGLMRESGVTTEAEADPPQPLPVFLGGNNGASGDHIGNWVVSRITERETRLRIDGVPTQIDFSVMLTEHVT